MWSKLSNVLKARNETEPAPMTPSSTTVAAESSESNVLSHVYEQHPNLSVFHQEDVPFPAPSPPSSPSKHSKLGIFRRASKAIKDEHSEISSSLRLPHLPKKVRSTLHIHTNSSHSSIPRPSTDTSRSSADVARPSTESATMTTTPSPHTPVETIRPSSRGGGSVRSILRDKSTPATGQSVRFFSRDAYRVITPDNSSSGEQPETLLNHLQQTTPELTSPDAAEDTRYHSTFTSPVPANVEAFSSPKSAHIMPSSFSPPGLNLTSFIAPVPPPDLTNIFDLSQEHAVAAIPVDHDSPLQDNAVEVSEFEDLNGEPGNDPKQDQCHPIARDESPGYSAIDSTLDRNRSLGRKAGESIFYSMASTSGSTQRSERRTHRRSSSSLGLYKLFGGSNGSNDASPSVSSSTNRNRAHSDTVSHRPLDYSLTESPVIINMSSERSGTVPGATNDTSAGALVVYGGASRSPGSELPDPFRVNATTYYTPEAGIPKTPPHFVPGYSAPASQSSSSMGVGRDGDELISVVVHGLRTQLSLQQELAAQYELDLRARDELVEVLSAKLEKTERDAEKRRGVVRVWKKKVAELERACRGLEEEVAESRHESFERSIMDEASGEALRQLHRQISQLEREKGEVEKREEVVKEELEALGNAVEEKDREIIRLRAELSNSDSEVRSLGAVSSEAKKQTATLGVQTSTGYEDDLKALVVQGEQAYVTEQERHLAAEFAWEEERARLTTLLGEVRAERDAIRDEFVGHEGIQEKLAGSEDEVNVLRQEVEAQWKNTEVMGEKMKNLESERDELRADVEVLEGRISQMELEWTESENRRVEIETELDEAWAGKEDIEKERNQLAGDIAVEREQVHELKLALEHQGGQVSAAQEERQFALDDVTRLKDILEQRDAELAEYTEKAAERELETEKLHDELSRLRKDHARFTEEKGRSLDDMAEREESALKRMEDLVKEKAEADVALGTLREHFGTMKNDVDKLRRQVHDLQQESADKEMKLMQLNKQRDQDKEDRIGLNIALDSKQQELELLKRRLGVRGTGGATPGPPSRIVNRRESSTFATPGPMRPISSLSEGGKEMKSSEKPSTAVKPSGASTLGKSIRGNSVTPRVTTPTTVKAVRSVDASMGPPPARKSLGGTPTSIARTPSSSALSRSTLARPSLPSLGESSSLRRSSSAAMKSANTSDASGMQEEKENARPTPMKTPARRTSMKPIPA